MAPSFLQALHQHRVRLQQPLLPRHLRHKTPRWAGRLSMGHALAVGAGALVALWIYLQLLVRHGTISPLATAMYTTPFDGRRADDFPPAAWHPSFRVVVSLTTTPVRVGKVMHTITSLLQQTLVPDQIYLHIPKGVMKRHPERSYEDVALPAELADLAPMVHINRCVDDGPATKLLGALRLEDDPSTLIITVDDDFEYPPQLVEALAWEAEHRPQDALGVCGWGIVPLPWHSVGAVPAYVPYFMRPTGRYVDILQACCGNAYRRGFFRNVEDLADIPPVCVTVDDVWIAGYLRTVENHRAAIVSKRLDPEDPEWKHEEARSPVMSAMKLSEFNHANQVHFKCMQAIESRFRRRWVRNYEGDDDSGDAFLG
ncbi:hypothetical protein PINS_up013005 [Pythium insidiosum]|nr:hypothetical protein PINS_up013005 [Pythium insidiosum]